LLEFDIDSQTSVRDLRFADILLGAADDQGATVRDYIARDHLKIAIEPEERFSADIQISAGWTEWGPEDFSGAFQDCEIGEFAIGDLMLAEAKRAQFAARLREWRTNKAKIVIYFQTEGEIECFRSSSLMKRSFMSHSSKPISCPAMSASEKNRRRSARLETRSGHVLRKTPPYPFLTMPAKCSRSRPSGRPILATHLLPTANGKPNLNIHSRSARRLIN